MSEALTQDGPDVEETDDGGAVVKFPTKARKQVSAEDHFVNLAEEMAEDELASIVQDLLTVTDKDIQSQKDRDDMYERGIERTGLVKDAPGGASFEGATKVTHPVLGEACVDFCARSSSELLPPDGIVRQKIEGFWSKEKSDRAWRKSQHMNYQLMVQCPEYRHEVEKCLTQMPLAGEAYLKVTWDKRRKKPDFTYIPATNIILPYGVQSFYKSHRITNVMRLSTEEVRARMRAKMYCEVELTQPGMEDETETQKAQNEIQGVSDQGENYEEIREVREIYADYDIPDPLGSDEWNSPYIITIDVTSKQVLRVQRNWIPEDKAQERMDYIVQWGMIPWDGAHYVGVWHLAGGLAKASIGALRALLDSAHINNAATMIRMKGTRTGGQNTKMQITQVTEVEGPAGIDDIKKLAMPLPFNPPSVVLFDLLKFCLSEARQAVQTTIEVADSPNVPVGTQLSRVEESMRVFKSIHTRLHEAQRRTLEIVHRLNSFYLDDEQVFDDLGEMIIRREDYQCPCDIHPVSDPNIFSDVQRLSQMQAVKSLQAANPTLYDAREVDKTILTLMRVPNIDQLMPPAQPPPPTNPVAENIQMSMGQTAAAYPDQDHIAHIKAHVQFLVSPIFGGNPLFQKALVPVCLMHIQQHLVMWYGASIHTILSKEVGGDITDALSLGTDDQNALAKAIAALSPVVLQAAQSSFGELTPVIQQYMKIAQQVTQPPIPPDPVAQVMAQDVQRKAVEGENRAQTELTKTKIQTEAELEVERMRAAQQEHRTDSTIEKAEIARDQAIEVAFIQAAQEPHPLPEPPLDKPAGADPSPAEPAQPPQGMPQ